MRLIDNYCKFSVNFPILRNSRPEEFYKKDALKIFAKFTVKHLCLFFNKVTALRIANVLKKRLWHWFFPVNFAKFLKTPFLKKTYGGCFRILDTLEMNNKRGKINNIKKKPRTQDKAFGFQATRKMYVCVC